MLRPSCALQRGGDEPSSVTVKPHEAESASATKQITALKFEYLGGPSTSTINYTGPSQYGYDTTATYTIYTFPGEQPLPSGYSGITASESVSGCSGCITGSGATNANSNVVDDLRVISSQPLPSLSFPMVSSRKRLRGSGSLRSAAERWQRQRSNRPRRRDLAAVASLDRLESQRRLGTERTLPSGRFRHHAAFAPLRNHQPHGPIRQCFSG